MFGVLQGSLPTSVAPWAAHATAGTSQSNSSENKCQVYDTSELPYLFPSLKNCP